MIPRGIIALWSGAIVDIPSGWILCDGNDGSPDLTDRFLVGAGDSYPVDASGGSNTHVHTFTAAPHTHTVFPGAAIAAGANFNQAMDSTSSTGTTDSATNLPPYYALAYIFKQ